MAKTIIEKIASKREKIQQLQNEEKQLLQKHRQEERKARTRRLCFRHGLLEKYLPDLVTITDEQFEVFVKRAIATSYGRDTLTEITGNTGATVAAENAETPLACNTSDNPNPATAAQSGA